MAALTSDGPGEIQPAPLGHQNLVAQHRQIGAAGDAIAHDGGELRNPRRGNDRVIAKDAAEVVFIWKNFILHRQKYAGRIDQVNQRQRVFECDPLRANHFLDRRRKKRAGFHGSVVGDDHARNAFDVPDTGDGSRRRDFPPLLVHFVGSPKSDLEKWRVLVEQSTKPFARGKRPILCWRSWPALPPPSRRTASSSAIAAQCARNTSLVLDRAICQSHA